MLNQCMEQAVGVGTSQLLFQTAQILPLPLYPELTDRKKSRKLERQEHITMEQKKTKKRQHPHGMTMHSTAGAVRLVTEQGRQPVEVAKELGICHRHAAQLAESLRYPDGPGQQTEPEQKRIRELEAENRSLRSSRARKTRS